MIQTGLFPLTGLLVGLCLYALYAGLLRLKADSRWAQVYIAASAVVVTLASVAVPVRTVYVAAAEGPAVRLAYAPAPAALPTADGQAVATHSDDGATIMAPEPLAWDGQAVQDSPVRLLTSDATALLGRLYAVGIVGVAAYFALQMVWLLRLRRRYPRRAAQGYDLYLTDGQPPFSFGRSIFLPSRMDAATSRYVLMHEQSHIAHRHFLKLCLMQLLVALNWYNPFVWLLFGEMRLQQELQVDGDVLRRGVDRQAYQLSLLRVCTQEGKWILLRSGFGLKPLKQRIIFMNKTMNLSGMRRRQTVAALGLVLVAIVAAAVGCQSREVTNTAADPRDAHHHPMRGCWTMDWISNTGSGEEVHPVAMHYGFYNDSTFLCFSYWSKRGINLRFSVSGEGYTWQGDSLLDAAGHLTDYTLLDDGRRALSRWLKDSTQMAGVAGPDITEQWSRIEPNPDLLTVFRAVLSAQASHERPRDGAWLSHDGAAGDIYCLVSDSVFMLLNLHPSTVARGFRYGGSGRCGSLNALPDDVDFSLTADDQLLLTIGQQPPRRFSRIAMPDYIRRAFSPALDEKEEQ